MLPTRFTQTSPGDMFIIRNAGNMVPHASLVSARSSFTEPAVFELACVLNDIEDIVICGHSDCKAINMLYDIHTDPKDVPPQHFSPLRAWVKQHGNRSMAEYFRLETAHFRKPLILNRLNKDAEFPAYIDVDEKFSVTDKLSMVNTLIQMENVSLYPIIRAHQAKGQRINVHAFWFDIYTGDIHIFSRKEKTFVEVNSDTMPMLEAEYVDVKQRGGAPYEKQPSESYSKLLQEARRNFSTSPCSQGLCHHPEHQWLRRDKGLKHRLS